MTIEKLSQVYFMKKISEGKSRYFHLSIDYRLFFNNWHIPHPYIINITNLIYQSKNNCFNYTTFMKRKNDIVYIQKKHYKNRQYLVNEIMKLYSVHSYGRDLNNMKWPVNITKQNKIDILSKYKFCLAIENSVVTWNKGKKFEADEINNDYVTEKLLDCFMAGSIPIYFGPKNINTFLPHNMSIINFNKYDNISDLVKYINKIKDNKIELKKHINWHNSYSQEWYDRFSTKYKFDYCKVCEYTKRFSNILK